jgi:hypothetical protein
MGFRIGPSLGLLATVAGCAVAGAVASFALIPDFLGHGPQLALLCMIGASLLGMAAWWYSEHLADAVNLNTRPLARLLLASAAAILVATPVAGAFGELAVGTPVRWVAPALVGLYVVSGLLPGAAVLARLAAFETALAARRGGGAVLDSVRPLTRHILLALLIGAGLGAGIAEYRATALETVAGLAPDLPRASV